MKKIFLMIFLITSLTSISQDTKLFLLLNQYRNANGKESVEWNDKLYKISKNQTNEMNQHDSLFHSGIISYECVIKGISLTLTVEDKEEFTWFLKKYFNIEYKDPAEFQEISKVDDYLLYYTIYSWHNEPLHHLIMLRDDVKFASCNILIKETKFKSNKVFFNGKVIEHKKMISHYNCIWFATLNLK